MAITFRGTKGSPLTHTELDQNFREFYYSSSFLGTTTNPYALKFFTSSSLDSGSTVYLPQAVGNQYNIQVKSGSDNISSSFFTSSDNFQYNFATNHLSVSGSGEYSGNLIVSGTLIANQYETVIVSSSIQFSSGSSNFGNTADDLHKFTGSINVNGAVVTDNKVFAVNFTGSSFTGSFNGDFKGTRLTGSLLSTNGVLSGSAQIASDISGSITSTSASLASTITTTSASIAQDISVITGSYSSSVSTRLTSLRTDERSLRNVTGSYAITGSNTFVGNQIISGTLEATSTFTLPNIADVSASIASAVGSSGIQTIVEDTTPQLGGKLHLNGQHLSGSLIHSGSTHLSGSVTASGTMFVDGLISASGDIIAFASSDERLKDNISPIDDALNKLNQIGGYEFDWNSDSEHSGHDVGVIAQEIEKVLPELVVDRKDGYKAVRYDKIVALLINAIKEQQLQIDLLLSKQ